MSDSAILDAISASNRSFEEFKKRNDERLAALETAEAKGNRPRVAAGGIGMTDAEVQKFSIVRAIRAAASNDWASAGFEREASRAVCKQLGRETAGFFVPADVQQGGAWGTKAIYQVGTAGAGGNLVSTDLMAVNFIDALRNTAQVMNAGATVLPGLVGNVDIPRRSAVSTGYWVAESGALTESEATFDKVSLRPKTVGALSKLSRLTLLQTTPGIEMLVRADLTTVLGLAVDLAALSGSGSSNQPTGVAATSGIGSVVGGTNGAAVTLDHLIQLEAAIEDANAPSMSRAYIINSAVVKALKLLKATTGSYLWSDSPMGPRGGTPSSVNGYPALRSNQVRRTLTKGTSSGVCSEIFFGNWSELLIGTWGMLEILVNPYDSTGFTTGDVSVRAFQTIDIGVRHAASFSYMADALTS